MKMITEQQFIEKATSLTYALLKTMEEFTKEEDTAIGVKISLLALAKASAGTIYTLNPANQYNETSVLDLFISTVSKSVDALEVTTDESKRIIESMMKKL